MIITLLTDFGTADYFVAAMKGVVLSCDQRIVVVDVTHDVPRHDVAAAAFTLLAVYRDFPARTVHLCVVDPGVGSERRGIVAACGGQLFVGPDNGLFSYILEREGPTRMYEIVEPSLWRHPVSSTFHGRDVFAPVAALLATGLDPSQVGPELADPIRLPAARPERIGDAIHGTILHVDRFGNCVTNLTRRELPEGVGPGGARLRIDGHEVATMRRSYAAAGGDGKVFAIWGSAGFLELSVERGSAAGSLGISRGHTIIAEGAVTEG
jgi:S-adenosyl-L-methionine hydrolase (adenosine-forming)